MSKALKCDCCKRCFDPIKETGNFTTIKRMVQQNGVQYRNHEFGYSDEEIHLCVDCTYRFNNFMARGYIPQEDIEEEETEIHETFDEMVSRLFGDITDLFRDNRSRFGGTGKPDKPVCHRRRAERKAAADEESECGSTI